MTPSIYLNPIDPLLRVATDLAMPTVPATPAGSPPTPDYIVTLSEKARAAAESVRKPGAT